MINRKLLDYLPSHLKKIKDFEYLFSSLDVSIKNLHYYLLDFEKQLFIDTCNEETLKNYEKLYNIFYRSNESIDIRKFRLLSRMQEIAPFTKRSLREYLSSILSYEDYKLEIDHNNFLINIKIHYIHNKTFKEIKNFLDRIIPCNMISNVIVLYNTYSYLISKNFTHLDINKNFTHKQLREEII